LETQALQYAIRRVQANQEGLKLNGTHQLLVYADDNILDKSRYTIKKNTYGLVVATKGSGLEINAEKTMYLAMSRDQKGGGGGNTI
jgi:hypothetical protein